MWLLQKTMSRGIVAQQNSAIFGKQWFKQPHSKRRFETACGKPNFNWFISEFNVFAAHEFRIALY